jgi:hypothetical protein
MVNEERAAGGVVRRWKALKKQEKCDGKSREYEWE